MFLSRSLLAAAVLVAGTGLVQAQDLAGGAVMTATTGSGTIPTDAEGMTLYTFDKDTDGVSVCNDDCATKWPPLAAAGDSTANGALTIVERADGTMQWAQDGKPLYLWQNDKAAGAMTGDGVGGVWHVAME